MEFLIALQNYFSFIASWGIFLTPLAMLVYALRRELKDLYERYLRQSRLARAIIAVCFSSAVVAGSIKPLLDAMDSDYAHEDYGHEMMGMCFLSSAVAVSSAPSRTFKELQIPLTRSRGASDTISATYDVDGTDFTPITNWTTRGAFEDWVTIDLPEGFAFPVGLTNITRVTLMAYGEIRRDLKTPIEGNGHAGRVTLPFRVSCQPGETMVSYGLTASNTFVIAWSNALSNRVMVASQWGSDVLVASDGTTDSTNDAMGTIASTREAAATKRLNAAIELFPSGAIATTITADYPSEVPTTYSLLPTPLPEGFYGSGQDEAWICGNFAALQAYDPSLTNVNQILDAGYSSWLTEAIGHDEPNGFYQVHVTVAALPSDGTPCYLVCGPWKMVVPAPGVYSFPLEVFDTYHVRTYPERVPLSFEYDDGYDYGEATSSSLQNEENIPLMALAATPTMPPEEELEYLINQIPQLKVSPSVIPLDQAVGKVLSIKCNMDGVVSSYSPSVSQGVRLSFHGKKAAVIDEAAVECMIEIVYQNPRGRVAGLLSIIRNYIDPSLWPTNELDDSETTNTVSGASSDSE